MVTFGRVMQRKMMSRLVEWKQSKRRCPLLLKGVRQVGKTYLLQEFGKLHFPNCHHLNFEKDRGLANLFEPDLIPQKILERLSFYIGKKVKVGEDLLIFDEVQECPRALTSLKYFQEDCPDLHICAAGSLLGLHLNSTSFPVGKVTFETLCPMSFEEFLMATEDKALAFFQILNSKDKIPKIYHDYLWEQLKIYFFVGGLPEVIKIYNENKNNLFEAFSLIRKKTRRSS